MQQISIPCPINEKDLCSDVLFENLFDSDTYCDDGQGTIIGFICGGVAKITYNINSSVVFLKILDRALTSCIKASIEQWLDIVRTGVNENSADDSVKLQTTLIYRKETSSCKIHFEYLIER